MQTETNSLIGENGTGFTQAYNTKFNIFRPMYIDDNGVRQIVRQTGDFDNYYAQINEHVNNGKK